MTRATATSVRAGHRCDAQARSFRFGMHRRALRGICGATLLLVLALPAQAQTSSTVGYGVVSLMYNQFPSAWADWSLGSASGTLNRTSEGTHLTIPPLTPVGSVVTFGFRDIMSNQTVCRIEVVLSSLCTAQVVAPGCSIPLYQMANNACMVYLRGD